MEQLRRKLQNFWFYHKIHLLIGLATVLILGYLGIQEHNTTEADYHIGLVRSIPCTDAQLQALEDSFTAAGIDINEDGQVVVQIHTYYVNLADDRSNAGVTNAEVVQALDADLIGGVSGLFLLEDVSVFRSVTGSILTDDSIPMDGGLFLTIRADASEAYTDLAEKITMYPTAP